MAQVSKYRYLLNQYPETVQKEQFRIICHISKRTARYLLQSGLVPCVQSGKKTRNYTITRLSLLPIGDCLASLFSSRQHMMLYLCLQGFVSVLAVMFFLMPPSMGTLLKAARRTAPRF